MVGDILIYESVRRNEDIVSYGDLSSNSRIYSKVHPITYCRNPFPGSSVFLPYSATFMYVYVTSQLCCAIDGYPVGMSYIEALSNLSAG